jgi:hypothetical protein
MSEGAGAATDYIMSLEPIHYWTMDGRDWVRDEVTGTQATKSPATAQKAISEPAFRGASRANATAAGDHQLLTNTVWNTDQPPNFSIIFSWRGPLLANTFQRFMGNFNAAQNLGFGILRIDNTNNTLRFAFGASPSNIALDTSFIFPTNTPATVAWTFDVAVGHKIYANGSEILSSANTDSIKVSGVDTRFFNTGAPALSAAFQGQMQDVAIFEKTLTPTEVANISTAILGA